MRLELTTRNPEVFLFRKLKGTGYSSEALRDGEPHLSASHQQTESGSNSRQQETRARNEKGHRSRERGASSIGTAPFALRRANPMRVSAVRRTVGAAPGLCAAKAGSIRGSDPQKAVRSEYRPGNGFYRISKRFPVPRLSRSTTCRN